jgi:DNA-binding winged helix-turn-helix (wHTH) protein
VRWLYDQVEDRLYFDHGGARAEIALSAQQHRLVSYMAQRNRVAGDGKPVLCGREELIGAVWGDEPNHGPQDLAYLVHQLRARLDAPNDAPLIVNERGRGYRLMLAELELHDAAASSPAPVTRVPRRWLALGGLAALLAVVVVLVVSSLARPAEPILREGSRGADVLALQRDLRDAGYDPVYLDGQYGPLTARAVRGFQQDNGLVVDGEVGPETRSALRRARSVQPSTPAAP